MTLETVILIGKIIIAVVSGIATIAPLVAALL